ncbi:MAG: hypothetical protein M3R12_04100 [Actinomycetota bacterium]|nr:hypothetical protein [Actinomycetota bacterium]
MKALVALLAMVALAGCGGGASEGDFVARAIKSCTETNNRIRLLGAPMSFNDTQLYARRAKDAVADGIDALNDLSPPADVRASFDLYLVTLEERQRLLGELAAAADRNSMNDFRNVSVEIDALGQTAREQAIAVGLAACEPK